jgi:hypothetical protein
LEAGYFYKMGFGFGVGEEFFDFRADVNVYVGGQRCVQVKGNGCRVRGNIE